MKVRYSKICKRSNEKKGNRNGVEKKKYCEALAAVCCERTVALARILESRL